jgi:hypothetical protein
MNYQETDVPRILAALQDSHKHLYRPLRKSKSDLIRRYYADCLLVPREKANLKLYNANKTLICNGYEGVVVGDYGAYIEFTKDQLNPAIKQKWDGPPKRKVKYIWMETKDSINTRVYFQQDTVPYADYKVGMYYVDPREVYSEGADGKPQPTYIDILAVGE